MTRSASGDRSPTPSACRCSPGSPCPTRRTTPSPTTPIPSAAAESARSSSRPRGKVEYDYGRWSFPTECVWTNDVTADAEYDRPGIIAKKHLDPDGTETARWTYSSTLHPRGAGRSHLRAELQACRLPPDRRRDTEGRRPLHPQPLLPLGDDRPEAPGGQRPHRPLAGHGRRPPLHQERQARGRRRRLPLPVAAGVRLRRRGAPRCARPGSATRWNGEPAPPTCWAATPPTASQVNPVVGPKADGLQRRRRPLDRAQAQRPRRRRPHPDPEDPGQPERRRAGGGAQDGVQRHRRHKPGAELYDRLPGRRQPGQLPPPSRTTAGSSPSSTSSVGWTTAVPTGPTTSSTTRGASSAPASARPRP